MCIQCSTLYVHFLFASRPFWRFRLINDQFARQFASLMMDVTRVTEAWRELLDRLPAGATYYVDDDILDALKWSSPGGIAGLVSRRDPHNIKRLPDEHSFPASAVPDSPCVVFLLKDVLHATKSRDKISSVLMSMTFQDCFVYSALDELAHVTIEGQQQGLFANVEHWLRGILAGQSADLPVQPDASGTRSRGKAVVKVSQLPMALSTLAESLFILNPLSNLFPMAEPLEEANQIRAAYMLSGLLAQFSMHEEFFALGPTSREIGSVLADYHLARRSSTPASAPRTCVVLVDRVRLPRAAACMLNFCVDA